MKPFLKIVAEDLVARLGDGLKDTAIVFNNKRPVAYMAAHFANIIGKPFWSPSFLTIQEFFAQSSSLKIADPFLQFFTLLELYNKQIIAGGGTAMDPAKFYPVAKIILGDFSQIDNDLVDSNRLFKELEDIAEIDFQFDYLTSEQQEFLKDFWRSYSEGKQKRQQEQFILMWRRMPGLYAAFHNALAEKGFTTIGNVYRKLAEDKHGERGFTDTFKQVVFVGFNALSRTEATVFKRLQDEGKALFYFDTDTYYMDDRIQEAGLFLRRNIQSTGLINALGEDGTYIKSSERTVNVYQAQGHAAQAKLLSEALEITHPANAAKGSTAIILADESLLLPVLQTIPAYIDDGEKIYPIPLNVTMGYPLALSAIFGLADLWINIQLAMAEGKTTVNYKDVEAFLAHPLSGVSDKMRNKIQQALIAEQLVDVPVERLTAQRNLFELFFRKIATPDQAVSHLQEALTFILQAQLASKTLRQTEADLFIAAIKDLNRLSDAISVYLEQLHKAAESKNSRSLVFLLSLIRRAVQGISAPLSGEPLEGIQVMGLLESRNLDFDQIYILGANEGILPQTNISPSFIPDGIRRAHGLPVLENQDAISAYMFYRLLHRAEKINFVYNAQSDDRSTGEPSRFIQQLEYESGYAFNTIRQHQRVSTPQQVPVEIKKDARIMGILNKYLSGEMRLSASAITTYINCPLQFFYRYIARIEEPKEVLENVEANLIGSMLHWVMEHFYQDLRKTDPNITAERITEARKQLPRLCESAFASVIFENENHVVDHSGMQKIILAIVEEYANVILNHDEKQCPFRIVDLEKRDQIRFEFEVNGRQEAITLHGIIDRIDERNGITRIVDYKTGSDELGFTHIEDVFDTDSKHQNKALVQTLFYTHVFEAANMLIDVEPNLYIVRKLNQGTLFVEGSRNDKTLLSGERLQSIKAEFIRLLKQKLAELFDENIPFRPTTNEAGFAYSPYTTLCGK